MFYLVGKKTSNPKCIYMFFFILTKKGTKEIQQNQNIYVLGIFVLYFNSLLLNKEENKVILLQTQAAATFLYKAANVSANGAFKVNISLFK